MPPAQAPFPFPTLHSCTRLASNSAVYDVKFYPYATDDDDQIFAVVTGSDTIVCRPHLDPDTPLQVLRWFKDEQCNGALLNSLVWTKDPLTGKPWLCVAGIRPKHIDVLDVESGRPVRSLAGHGRSVNDLAVSPLSTNLLSSAAEDKTIRLWNLEPSHARQPCVALLSGEGHKDPVLAIHFHPNGKWLLSGGIDNAVCLWAVPELAELQREIGEDGFAEPGEPRMIYYPHFYTQELHSNYVDCLAFYGDLVISRCSRDQNNSSAQNEILIWKIDGFDSGDPAPCHPPIPVPGERTRSSFPHQKGFRGFQRLLTLDMLYSDRFYKRFGLFHSPSARPILALGDQKSTYHFWDLQSLEDGIDRHDTNARKGRRKKGKAKVGSAADVDRLGDLRRSESVAEGTATSSDASGTQIGERRGNPLSDRFKPIQSHYTKLADVRSVDRDFSSYQVAWSPDGTWMIGVGDYGMVCLFHRDKSVVVASAEPQHHER